MERVVDLREKRTRLFGLVEAEDAVLLVAAGDVIAGVDLSTLRPEDVTVDPEQQRATIILPKPTVLVTRLDAKRTYVHTRKTTCSRSKPRASRGERARKPSGR